MRKVRFKADYRGKLTDEEFYATGSEALFTDSVASTLVGKGWVAEYVDDEPEPEPEPEPAPKRRGRPPGSKNRRK